jgi:hypothetical protein
MELGTQVKKQDGLHLCRDLRERTVGLLGTNNMAAERGLKGVWNCRVYTEEAFRHNTIKGYIYYILHSVLDLIHASD